MSTQNDVPPNSLKDPNVNPRAEQYIKKRVMAHSLIRNILKVGKCAKASKWD